jgi:hypothetical protein
MSVMRKIGLLETVLAVVFWGVAAIVFFRDSSLRAWLFSPDGALRSFGSYLFSMWGGMLKYAALGISVLATLWIFAAIGRRR